MTGDFEFDAQKWRAEALGNFPYEIRKVAGRDALKEWNKLRQQEGVYPVVVGGDDELDMLLAPFHPSYYAPGESAPSVKSLLEAAASLKHPESLKHYLKEREAFFEEALKVRRQEEKEDKEDKDVVSGGDPSGYVKDSDFEPDVGDWPAHTPTDTGLSVAYDIMSGRPLPSVNIVLLPTDDGTEAPAFLRWGNWNDNPPPEHHVAALRSWRDRYGAELVGMSHDVMNLRVANKPKTRKEALELAREQYDYCYDIVDQGTGVLAPLAASLMEHEWWYFWWD